MIKGTSILMVAVCFFFTQAVYGNTDEEPILHPPVVMQDDPVVIETPKDVVPNFAAYPTVVSKQSGNWFDVSTWEGGRIPGANDVVKVEQGHAVNYSGISNVSLAALGIEGTLTFNPYANSRIKVGTILVYRDGKLDVGTLSNPIASHVKVEIVIANRALATTAPDPATGAYDPLQFGTGIVAFGEVNMHGREMAPTWVKLAQDPKAGHTALILESSPSGWSVGDKLVLPDTRQLPVVKKWQADPVTPIMLQLEELTIASISGNTVILSQPLLFDHLGGRDTDGNIIGMPHVGNLTRNIVVRSEDPNGVRGHVMFTERAKIDVRYVGFVGMGRTTAEPLDNTIIENGVVTHVGTNQIGRYPIHMHHHMGPVNTANTGYQFALIGNAVEDGAKWGIAVHNSHFGLIDGNVVYDIDGASIITEEGNERENVFSNNFAVKVGTMITSLYEPRYGGVAALDRPLKFADFGYEGSALWFTGNDDYVTGNVAANAAFAGLMYNARSRGFGINQPLVPNFRGADIDNLTQWTKFKNTWAPEIRLSRDNEVYASSVGIWISFAGTVGKVSDSLFWNIRQKGLYSQRNASVMYENITIVSDQAVSNQNYIGSVNIGIDLYQQRYRSGHTVFKNVRVEGFNLGIDLPAFLLPESVNIGVLPPRITLFDDIYLRNYVNVRDRSPVTAAKNTLLKDVEFLRNSGPSNKFLSNVPADIVAKLESSFSISARTSLSHLYVKGYNKQPGDDFEFFFYEQAPDHVMQDVTAISKYANPNDNCPTDGLTNQQCWDQHGVATMNRVATCSDTYRSEVHGYTCPIGDTTKLDEILSEIP